MVRFSSAYNAYSYSQVHSRDSYRHAYLQVTFRTVHRKLIFEFQTAHFLPAVLGLHVLQDTNSPSCDSKSREWTDSAVSYM